MIRIHFQHYRHNKDYIKAQIIGSLWSEATIYAMKYAYMPICYHPHLDEYNEDSILDEFTIQNEGIWGYWPELVQQRLYWHTTLMIHRRENPVYMQQDMLIC